MIELYCSIEQIDSKILSDQIFHNLFEEERKDNFTLYSALNTIHHSLKIYAVDRFIRSESTSSDHNPMPRPPVNVGILLWDMDKANIDHEGLLTLQLDKKDFGDEKTPVIIIGHSKKEKSPEVKIDYEKIAMKKNRFLYVLPTILLSNSIKNKIAKGDHKLNDDEKKDLDKDIGPSLKIAFKVGVLMSPRFKLKGHKEDFSNFLKEILFDQYPSTAKERDLGSWVTNLMIETDGMPEGIKENKGDSMLSLNQDTDSKIINDTKCKTSIAHLVARMNVGWGVKRLIDNFSEDDIFCLITKKDQPWGQTALMEGAILSRDATLTAFLTFYAVILNMSELHTDTDQSIKMRQRLSTLLHEKDRQGKTLVYYITHAEEKCLGPYGMIMQFEKNLHLGPSNNDRCYAELNRCLKKNLGSSKDTCKAVELMNRTKSSTTPVIFALVCRILFSVLILPMSLYIADLITDAFVADTYYIEEERIRKEQLKEQRKN